MPEIGRAVHFGAGSAFLLATLAACGAELEAPSVVQSPPGRGGSSSNPPPGGGNPSVEPPGVPNDPSIDPPDVTDPARRFTCDEQAEKSVQTLRRLSRSQYEGAVRDLAEAALAGPLSSSDDARLGEAIRKLPADVLSEDEDYPSLVQAVGQAHVDAYREVAVAIAEVGADSAADRCAGDCDGVLEDLAEIAFRRPISSEELSFLGGATGTGNQSDDMDRALRLLAQSPDFLYHLEDGAQSADELDAYELANRLAFHFWNAPPDAELLASAASGALMTEDAYREQVDRIFEDPRTQQSMHAFFEAWLELEELPDMAANVERSDFRAFAGENLPSPRLREDLIEDTLAFIDHVVWTENGSFSDLFTRSVAVPPSSEVADLYGVDAVGEAVELDPRERAGLLSRPALLAYNQAVTRPIIRGALVRVRLSCAELVLPDQMDDIQIPEANPAETTRAKVEDLTEAPGTTCAGCHQLLNPFGFALERYDALGRHREQELVFDADGMLSASHPLDLETETPVDGVPVRFSGPIEMSAALAQSQDIERCFARHLFRHSFGRTEEVLRDGCTLEAIRDGVHRGAPLAEVFRSIAFTPEFRSLEEVYE